MKYQKIGCVERSAEAVLDRLDEEVCLDARSLTRIEKGRGNSDSAGLLIISLAQRDHKLMK